MILRHLQIYEFSCNMQVREIDIVHRENENSKRVFVYYFETNTTVCQYVDPPSHENTCQTFGQDVKVVGLLVPRRKTTERCWH